MTLARLFLTTIEVAAVLLACYVASEGNLDAGFLIATFAVIVSWCDGRFSDAQDDPRNYPP